jgi:hypothetical protein
MVFGEAGAEVLMHRRERRIAIGPHPRAANQRACSTCSYDSEPSVDVTAIERILFLRIDYFDISELLFAQIPAHPHELAMQIVALIRAAFSPALNQRRG